MPGTFLTTANFGLRRLLGTSKGSDIDEGFQRLAEDVDQKMLGYVADTFAKRPAAGIANRIFRATDTGTYYLDTGTLWVVLFVAGAWEKPKSLSTKLEETTGTPRVRRVGDIVQCQGVLLANNTVPAGTTLWTMPMTTGQTRYCYAINASTLGTIKLTVSAGGIVQMAPGSELSGGNAMSIDPVTYSA